MDIRNRRALKQEAAAALQTSPNQKKIIAVYAGISLLVTLAVVLLDLLLSHLVEDTSGLSNIGNRVILQTIQNILPIAQLVVLLPLQYGYLSAVLGMARRRDTDLRDLTGGFRLFGPILRLTLLKYAITFALSFACIYLGTMVFVFSPFAAPLSEALSTLVTDTSLTTADLMADSGVMAAMMDSMIPMLVIILVIYCLLVVPITYLFRMSGYCLLDEPQAGAIAALRSSRNMMRRNRMNLLKLDLSFWWYYLLMLIPTLLCYGDLLLPLVGVTLPFGAVGNELLCYSLYLVSYFGLCYGFQNRLEVTYANAYESLRPKPQTGGVVLGNIFQM